MILHCLADSKIIVDGIELQFGNVREVVRTKLPLSYKEANMNEFNLRRDIYRGFNNERGLFFLNYDNNSLLSEIEVHWCERIGVRDTWFDFNTPLEWIAGVLEKYSPGNQSADGEYFFEGLKITILDETQMGGVGCNLSYFYYASDVSHLNKR